MNYNDFPTSYNKMMSLKTPDCYLRITLVTKPAVRFKTKKSKFRLLKNKLLVV